MLTQTLINKVADEFHLKPSEVELLYKLWWKEVKTSLENNDLKNYKECEHTDINIPLIGKLIVNTHKADIINERISYKRDSAS